MNERIALERVGGLRSIVQSRPTDRRNFFMRLVALSFLGTLVSSLLTAGLAEDGSPGVPVKAIRVEPQEVRGVISAMGSINCPRSLELGFEDFSCIAEVLVDEGDKVEQGMILAKLDNSVLAAEKHAAEAKLKSAEADVRYQLNEVEKKEKLFQKEAVSDTEVKKARLELEKAEANVEMARAEIRTIESRLERRILRAPVSGVIAQRHLDVGAVISPGSNKVFTLIRCSDAYADLELGERFYSKVRPGQRVNIEIDALMGRRFQGSLSRVGSQVDKKARTFKVRVRLPNPDLALRPGMFAKGEILVEERDGPVTVPSRAVLKGETGKNYVFVVKDGVALQKEVIPGDRNSDAVQIIKGLERGDIVVIEGQDHVANLEDVAVTMVDRD